MPYIDVEGGFDLYLTFDKDELAEFGDYNLHQVCYIFVPDIVSRSYRLIHLQHDPLGDRAWALQERTLAPRALGFHGDYSYWNCSQRFENESGAASVERQAVILDIADGT